MSCDSRQRNFTFSIAYNILVTFRLDLHMEHCVIYDGLALKLTALQEGSRAFGVTFWLKFVPGGFCVIFGPQHHKDGAAHFDGVPYL